MYFNTGINLHFLLYSFCTIFNTFCSEKLKGAIKFIELKVCSNHVNCKQIVWTINQRRTNIFTSIERCLESGHYIESSKASHHFFQ